MKKLSKVISEDDKKLIESEVADILKKAEQSAKEVCDAKEAELNQA